jgi:hypothetical protein
MTGIPDELLAINFRLKSILDGLKNHNEIVVDYKVMISQFRIVASMPQYKETIKNILMETKGLINDVFQSKRDNILRFLKKWDEYEVFESGTTTITDDYGIEKIVPDIYSNETTHITTIEKRNEWFDLIKVEVKAYSQLLIENDIQFEYLPEEVKKNEDIIDLIVNAKIGSDSIFKDYSKEQLRKLLLEYNLIDYTFTDKDSIQIGVDRGPAAYFFSELINNNICDNFNILLNNKKRVFNYKTELTTAKLRSDLSRVDSKSKKEIDAIITQIKAL